MTRSDASTPSTKPLQRLNYRPFKARAPQPHQEELYQISHLVFGFIAEPAGQVNAWENSGRFCRGPIARNLAGECTSVNTCSFKNSANTSITIQGGSNSKHKYRLPKHASPGTHTHTHAHTHTHTQTQTHNTCLCLPGDATEHLQQTRAHTRA